MPTSLPESVWSNARTVHVHSDIGVPVDPPLAVLVEQVTARFTDVQAFAAAVESLKPKES